MIFTRAFWKAALERSIATGAQAAVAVLGVDGLGLLDIEWAGLGSVVGAAMLLSVLKGLAAGAITGNGPGVGSAESIDSEV